eukprot:scaffold193318_cov25-Tisochrysis_lutea.AAC.2
MGVYASVWLEMMVKSTSHGKSDTSDYSPCRAATLILFFGVSPDVRIDRPSRPHPPVSCRTKRG